MSRKRKFTPVQMRIIRAYYKRKRKERREAKRIASGRAPRVYTPVDRVTGRDNIIPISDEIPFQFANGMIISRKPPAESHLPMSGSMGKFGLPSGSIPLHLVWLLSSNYTSTSPKHNSDRVCLARGLRLRVYIAVDTSLLSIQIPVINYDIGTIGAQKSRPGADSWPG